MRSIIGRVLTLILTPILFLTGPAHASDDVQYWQRLTLKTWQSGPWNLSTTGEFRQTEDLEDATYFQVTERLGYRLADWIESGIAYTYLSQEIQVRGGEEFKEQHRLELEANPKWKLAEWVELKNRNRVEFRWIEDRGSDNSRFRQLWELVFPLKGLAPWKAVYTNTELFYDFNRERIVEYRTSPIGLDLKLSDQVGLKVFYMIQSTRGTNDWAGNQIIGSHITLSW